MKKTIRNLLLLFFSVTFLVSAFMVISYVAESRRQEAAFEELKELAFSPSIEEPTAETGETSTVSEPDSEAKPEAPTVDCAALHEKNPDVFGWIEITETKLSYPVMHTPDNPEYYLRRAFDGSRSVGGVPFLDASCTEGCGNYLVYGHNMKNGTMFATLLSYADPAYRVEHPAIRFSTLSGTGEYEVMAAFYSKVYNQNDEGVFRFYRYTDLSDPTVFDDYVRQVQAAALYDAGVTASYGDRLLTLSTCSYHTADGRFVVVAKETQPKIP